MNVLIMYGGASPEHAVSVRSAATIADGLRQAGHQVQLVFVSRQGQTFLVSDIKSAAGLALTFNAQTGHWQTANQTLDIDVIFPIIHGVTGEDGVLQAKLDKTGIPYVGCDAAVSALCFDKVRTKETLAVAGIKVSPGIIVHNSDKRPNYSETTATLGPILFIKPSRSGSSIGVNKVSTSEVFEVAMDDAFTYDNTILIESAIAKPRELEVAVLEDETGALQASGAGEIRPGEMFYSYNDKYADDSKASIDITPTIPSELAEQITQTAVKTAEVLGCRGLVRVDFLYATETGVLYVNEVNTLPGFTSISMFPKLWETAGLNLPQLCDRLVKVASGKSSAT